jgi:hypothetical protein
MRQDKKTKDIITPPKGKARRAPKFFRQKDVTHIDGLGRPVDDYVGHKQTDGPGKGRAHTLQDERVTVCLNGTVHTMLDVLCSEWECNRSEAIRRLLNPLTLRVIHAMKEGKEEFSLEHTWSLKPEDWPRYAWR